MELRELHCQSCGAPLDPDQVVERLAMARCSHCGAVFALETLRPATAAAGPSRKNRPKVPLPPGMQMQDFGSSLEITRRWFHPALFFAVFFCIVWNGFMIVWHTMALSHGAWFMSCFGLLHTAVGVAILYGTLAGFLNTTVIRVQQGLLEVRSGPLPWPGNKTLPADELEQIYCQEHVSRNKNGSQTSYQVLCLRRGNVRETLLKGCSSAEQALFIEQELERFLHLEDRPITGELPA